MAQADSVRTAIRGPITGATSKASSKHPTRCWYERITGGMPIGAYFYATAVILLACAPWNFLLIVGLLLSKDDVLRFWISSGWGRSS